MFFDEYAMKNDLKGNTKIAYGFLMGSKSIDLSHVCHLNVYRLLLLYCCFTSSVNIYGHVRTVS